MDLEKINRNLSVDDIAAIAAAPEGTLFRATWRNQYVAVEALNIEQFHAALAEATFAIARWMELGVTLLSGCEDDCVIFATTSKAVALSEGFFVVEADISDDGQPG
jgi:hypothetical protein